MDERAVRALLEALAETEQPPSRVDIAHARREGRKLRWCFAALKGAPVVAVVVVVAMIAAGAVGFGPGSQRGGGNWGTATKVPGTAALNQGGYASILSVSCGSAGNCSAGGFYTDTSRRSQAFVVSQKNGIWGAAKKVPGTAALNQGGNADISSVSCGSPGNCSAGGRYQDGSGRRQAFVVSQKNGIWGTAEEVPGTAALNRGGGAFLASVSCGSPGNCSAGGIYKDRSGRSQAFVVSQKNGTWGKAEEVPGFAALNQGGEAGQTPTSVSCGSPGNCSAGGIYKDRPGRSGRLQVFVVSQKNGTWGTAKKVPGMAALNQGGDAAIFSVSCGSPGNCSAGGEYKDSSHRRQAFVVSQTNGTWGTAKKVPGTAALNEGGDAYLFSVSCGSPGNCSAGGQYKASPGLGLQAFVVSETNGTWGTAKKVPGTAALNQGRQAAITSVSCASPGNCSAGGYYTDSSGRYQVFVVSQTNGAWGTAKEMPGTAALNQGGDADLSSVSCGSPGNCSAGGAYKDSPRHHQAYVDSET